MKNSFSPNHLYAGEYVPEDGTVQFYQRINSLLEPSFSVLNLGAGRGAWYYIDNCKLRRELQDIRPKVNRYIGADIDKAVLENPVTSSNVLIVNDRVPIEDQSFDLIISDWVLEHVQNPSVFCAEVNRLLKPGGFFCARTPHNLAYWAFVSRLVDNAKHSAWLKYIQPSRLEIDTFPVCYKLNTLKKIEIYFPRYHHFSYLYCANPSYYFGNELLYRIMSCAHKSLLTARLSSSLFVFVRKPQSHLMEMPVMDQVSFNSNQ
jgi:SAM-dependent methyltransferase